MGGSNKYTLSKYLRIRRADKATSRDLKAQRDFLAMQIKAAAGRVACLTRRMHKDIVFFTHYAPDVEVVAAGTPSCFCVKPTVHLDTCSTTEEKQHTR